MIDFKSSLELNFQEAITNNFTTDLDEIPVFNENEKSIMLQSRQIARDVLGKIDLSQYAYFYNLLKDDYSKNLFIDLFVLRILGPTKKRLPLSNKNIWLKQFDIENLCKKEPRMHCPPFDFNLYDLRPLGYDYQAFTSAIGIIFTYYLQEYEYHKNGISFQPEKGDYIIDGGAFIGDTALYFADKVGEKGKVFSFEFVKENVEACNKNFELNPHFKDRIELFQNALWSNSNEFLYVSGVGPASHVTMAEPPSYTLKIPSKSIDDLVKENEIPKIDLIKLDIEGAELECLKGAQKTIDTFKPKLAVCVYHKPDDFITIPPYINETHPFYDFYLDHHTATYGETVLYALPKK